MTATQIFSLIAPQRHGSIAQSVEQRIENPCVGSSNLPRATIRYSYFAFKEAAKKPQTFMFEAFFMAVIKANFSESPLSND